MRSIRIEMTVTVARESHAQSPRQHAFVARHPLHSKLMCNREYFFGNTALRRPHSLWSQPKYLFVEIHAAQQLLPRILGMEIAILRQGQSRGRNRSHLRIAHQRQNGM